jgi:hypothetical protein
VNLPPPPQPSSLPPEWTTVAELQAWHELKQQMEELHAQLHYLKLLLKLGVKAW